MKNKYKIKANNQKECYELLEIGALEHDGIVEDAIIAEIYDMEEFQKAFSIRSTVVEMPRTPDKNSKA